MMRFGISLASCIALCAVAAAGAERDNYYSDPPPLQATNGIAGCPPPVVRVLTPEQARGEAHQRVERGTSCWLAGTCEPGGDYKNDGEINERVAAAIAKDARFANSSIWVETLRKFVTLKGCIASAEQGRSLEAMAKAIAGVKLVWQEAKVTGPRRRS